MGRFDKGTVEIEYLLKSKRVGETTKKNKEKERPKPKETSFKELYEMVKNDPELLNTIESLKEENYEEEAFSSKKEAFESIFEGENIFEEEENLIEEFRKTGLK